MPHNSTTDTMLNKLNSGTVDWNAGRRAFLGSLGALAGAAVIGPLVSTEAHALTVNDTNILNFALNLEYLEAEFYLRAAFGQGLQPADVTGSGTLGPVNGGRRVVFATAIVRNYAAEIAQEERAHVRFLRSALGSGKVARPRIDLKNSFTAAAVAAGLIQAGGTFDPFENETNFLIGAFIFEDVGVTAYKGAARLLNNKDVLEAAAGLLAVEAYHAGTIRAVLYSRSMFDAAWKISNLRDSVDGESDLDRAIGDVTRSNIAPTDSNGLAFSRTTDQVLSIVYLGGNDSGGFFPDGFNGPIS